MSGWVEVVLCFALSGALGGILGTIQFADINGLMRSSDKSHWGKIRGSNVALALVLSALGGIGGAAAAMLVMALDKKLTCPPDCLDILLYIGLGTVSGFLGFTLLRKIAAGVDKLLEVKKLQEDMQKTTESVAQVEVRTDAVMDAIPKGLEAQKEFASDVSVANGIAALERANNLAPDNRTVAMMLSWLYADKRKNPQMSVDVLSKALKAMKEKRTETDDNVADILYNRACFYYRLAESAEGLEKESLKERMYKDLEESVRLKRENARDARDEADGDFANVKSEDRFQKIAGLNG